MVPHQDRMLIVIEIILRKKEIEIIQLQTNITEMKYYTGGHE
jgi:hypothetical protein